MDAEETQRRPSRKSVAFTEEKLVVDADGTVTKVASPHDETRNTAMSHTPTTPPLSAALEASKEEAASAPTENPTADEDLGLPLKKKKKPKKAADDAEGDDAAAADGDADGDEPVLDLGLKKKKKKKAVKVAEGGEDDFEAKLEALNIDKEGGEEEQQEQSGDMDKGTGVWQHDESKPIVYDLLLQRFFKLLSQKNPDHAAGGSRSYKIPPPQCMREGNKKTIFVNLAEICRRMNRSEEHVTAFLFTELGTSGSVADNGLVIKGRFQSKQLENVLRKYIIDYVTCKTCRSPDTTLSKGENRLYFITCNSCQSRRSVQAIKTGFSAQVGKRRKMQG